jgi:hypothetical protein
MRKLTLALLATATLASGSAWAYGGGGSSSSGCAEPKFFEPQPSGTAASLGEFAFVASDNTDPASLAIEVNGEKVPPAIARRRNGDYDVKASLPQPITQPGKVRIGVTAKSNDGCAGFQPWYLEIKP